MLEENDLRSCQELCFRGVLQMAGGGAAVPGGRRKAGFLLREASGSPAEHLFPPLSTEDSVGLDSVEALPSTFRCHATASSSSLPSWSTFGLGWLVMRYLAAGCGREDGYNYNQVHHCYHGRGEQHSTTSGSPDREGVFQAQGRCAPVQVRCAESDLSKDLKHLRFCCVSHPE